MASKTIELRKDIKALLDQVTTKAFYRRAADDVPYPYLTYFLKDIGDSKVIEIDYWDRAESSTYIETLADNIESLLSEEIINTEEHSLIFYYNNDRKWIDDEDKTILRINETFEIRYYGKEKY